MKKLLFTFAALLAMLFAFSSCDALLDIIGNQENQTEKEKEDDDKPEPETKVPTTLADFAGETFVCYENPETGYGTFAYVKDEKTIYFLRIDDDFSYSEDSEIDESGIFWNEVFGRAHAMKIVDGRFFIYISSSNYEIETYHEDLHACEKQDDSAGLIGTWRYCDTSDHPRPCDYEITTNTITKYVLDDSDYDTRTQEWSKTYTEKNGLLLDSDNDILAYYDGESLHTEGINELIKITDAAKAKKIKKAILGDEYVDDEGGNTIPKTFEDCIGTYHYWKDYYYEETEYYAYIKDKKTIILYNIADKSLKESINYGEGFDGFMPWDIGIDVRPNGELVCYRTMFGHAIKTDDKEGLYGNWIDQTEQEHEFVIDENTVNGVKYVNKSNFLDFEDNSYSYDLYYDGEYLWTEGAGEFKRVDEKDLSAEIKEAINVAAGI